jgi:hypothetical protein
MHLKYNRMTMPNLDLYFLSSACLSMATVLQDLTDIQVMLSVIQISTVLPACSTLDLTFTDESNTLLINEKQDKQNPRSHSNILHFM